MASFLPKGNISPCRGVKMSSTPFSCVQVALATDRPIGVAQEGTQLAPGLTGSDGYAGRDGGPGIRVFQDGEECLMELAATVDESDICKCHTDGTATPILYNETTNIWSIWRPLESGSAGEKVRGVVFISPLRPA